jgi:hypothetical protein
MRASSKNKTSEVAETQEVEIPKLSTSASRLLLFLKKHTGSDGLAIYTKHELALLLGTSEKTITRSVQKLLRAKAITVVPRFDDDGRQLANAYRVADGFEYAVEARGRKAGKAIQE